MQRSPRRTANRYGVHPEPRRISPHSKPWRRSQLGSVRTRLFQRSASAISICIDRSQFLSPPRLAPAIPGALLRLTRSATFGYKIRLMDGLTRGAPADRVRPSTGRSTLRPESLPIAAAPAVHRHDLLVLSPVCPARNAATVRHIDARSYDGASGRDLRDREPDRQLRTTERMGIRQADTGPRPTAAPTRDRRRPRPARQSPRGLRRPRPADRAIWQRVLWDLLHHRSTARLRRSPSRPRSRSKRRPD